MLKNGLKLWKPLIFIGFKLVVVFLFPILNLKTTNNNFRIFLNQLME